MHQVVCYPVAPQTKTEQLNPLKRTSIRSLVVPGQRMMKNIQGLLFTNSKQHWSDPKHFNLVKIKKDRGDSLPIYQAISSDLGQGTLSMIFRAHCWHGRNPLTQWKEQEAEGRKINLFLKSGTWILKPPLSFHLIQNAVLRQLFSEITDWRR